MRGLTANIYKNMNWKKAQEGDANAQFKHAYSIEDNDIEGAVKWYEAAAKQGHVRAQFNLGWCFEKGKGAPPNH